MKSDKELESPEHGSGQSGQFVALSRGQLQKNAKGENQLPPEIIDSETPSTTIIEALQKLMHEVNGTKEANETKKEEQK